MTSRKASFHWFWPLAAAVGLMLAVPHSAAQPRVVEIRDQARLLRIQGKNQADRLGISIEVADFTGDGVADLAVASDKARAATGTKRVGRVDLFDGNLLTSTLGTIDLNETLPSSRLTLYGDFNNGLFGERIVAGDFDGNGTADLAIAAPKQNIAGRQRVGRIFLYFGETLRSVTGTLLSTNADVKIDGARPEQTGQFLTVGDFNGDGASDLIVGAPGATVGSKKEAGKVYVVEGRPRNVWPPPTSSLNLNLANINSVSAALIQTRVVTGERENDRLGESVGVGDINGDGFDDLFIGEDHRDRITGGNSTELDVGAVHLLYGQNVLPGTDYSQIDLKLRPADVRFEGRAQFDLFGDSIMLVDWDGVREAPNLPFTQDLWVSAPFAEWNVPASTEDDRGLLSMIPGSPTIFSVTAPPSVVRFPTSASRVLVGPSAASLFAGDFTFGNLLTAEPGFEMAVSSSRYRGGKGPRTGAVHILTRAEVESGIPPIPFETRFIVNSVRIQGERSSDRFGFRVKSLPVPGSHERLVVSAPQSGTASGRSSSGSVYILDASAMAFVAGSPSPTFVPTFTRTPTLTRTETATATPVAARLFDLAADGSVDFRDLFLFSRGWMAGAKGEAPIDAGMLLGVLQAMRGGTNHP